MKLITLEYHGIAPQRGSSFLSLDYCSGLAYVACCADHHYVYFMNSVTSSVYKCSF